MALGDSYATTAELKSYLRITDTAEDTLLSDSLSTASRLIEHHCDRQFNKTTSASARVFYASSSCTVHVDDFHTTTDLVIKHSSGDDGTYDITLTTADYQLLPLNGIVSGESGWPYYRIELQGFYVSAAVRPQIEVTAQWGWTAVPAAIKRACIQMASEVYKLKGAPFDVAGMDQFGPIRIRESQRVTAMLVPYRRHRVLVA